MGTSFREVAAAKSRPLPPWNSGYQDACLQGWRASQQPRAAGCNYVLQLQRKSLAAGACAGPGCTLAAGLKGTMETNQRQQRKGRSRTRVKTGPEKGREPLLAQNREKPASTLQGSPRLFPRWKTKSVAPGEQPLDLVLGAVPADHCL